VDFCPHNCLEMVDIDRDDDKDTTDMDKKEAHMEEGS
jgi:hypothetical protein